MLQSSSLNALLLALLAAPSIVSAAIMKKDVNVGFPYGKQKIRGVNLGGWLVAEPFITPSLFEATGNDAIVDEWTFGQYQDRATATAALKAHWDSWITLSDFQQIAAAGLNHVRLPLGYWALDVSGGEPYIQGSYDYVFKAVDWARQTGLHIEIDLHSAPGSQNGYDNSGHRGAANWATQQSNIDRTNAIIQTLALEFSKPDYWQVVTAVGSLNEPAGYMNSQLLNAARQFWYDSYGTLRWPWAKQGNGNKSGLLVVIHDAFQPLSSYNGFMNYPAFEDIMIDTHYYQCFSQDFNQMNWDQHNAAVCAQASNYKTAPNWLMVGEWSLAVTDCAKWLNGRGLGARYDGSLAGSTYVASCDYYTSKKGDGSDFSADYKAELRHFWDIQVQTYENSAQGYMFWTWKTEAAPEWSYQAGLAGGWIPSDPTSHIYSC